MNIFEELQKDLKESAYYLYPESNIWDQYSVEIPKDHLNGDISTNIAMLTASIKHQNPKEVALRFKDTFKKINYLAHIEVAGPGFINFTIKASKWHDYIQQILSNNSNFWNVNVGNGELVNIEYVSANPTGPIHMGHARVAVYGDVLANILSKSGYNVVKEYYVNDSGSQIDILIDSVILRYKEVITNKPIVIPEGLYPGGYLKELARVIYDKYGSSLLDKEEIYMKDIIKKITITEMMNLIKRDLSLLGVEYDKFFFESSLHSEKKIDQVVEIMQEKGLIYQGVLPAPKGKLNPNWKKVEHMLFRSSSFGDAQDRSIQKQDGSWSYFASDLAYAKNKIDRGFQNLIFILGADHSGYVSRISAIVSALSDNKVKSDIKIVQLVNFANQSVPIKMSKRNGNFVSISSIMKNLDKDIIRFIMLTRKSDMVLEFDLDKFKEQSQDNPVFYVQYAHVRICSIISRVKISVADAYDKFINNQFDLSLLSTEEEIQLIKLLAIWPKILINAAKYHEPHRIAYYLIEIASKFHTIWNLGKSKSNYLFVVSDNVELTAARLAFVQSIKLVMVNALSIIGIKPIDKM
ncbi:arginine--tRNA ligase [Rickettsia endosymbiont of Cardiosporidium cionae]|uniref:arginine--tRNA ligase n=1 Tax=Rickettsia endosymbiont of Cardiosporidium cionae TaxID=2777155 RepID=UPI0018955B99|nr:arginine--tRNA ligase [Rickettsia endosymbiont of Cardiosporidium cionae]KAF8818477.1 arginine--tRNA ligase [Rickettsia endosymbiont of Cardiosporidium cionae]